MQIRIYALNGLRLVSSGSISPTVVARREPYEITLGSLVQSTVQPIISGAARPLSVSLPRRDEKRNDAAEEMDWEPETPATVTWTTQQLETPKKITRRTAQALANLQSSVTSASTVPPSPLDDWTRFRNDIMTETMPNLAIEPSATEAISARGQQERLNVLDLPTETFRTAYAFCALLRILAMINALAAGSSGTVRGLLADTATTMEMIASVGARLGARHRKQVSQSCPDPSY